MTMFFTPDSSIQQQPTSSETACFSSPKKPDAAASHHPLSYIPVYSSDEEDDSRDRQSHWKRIKTRSDDGNSNNNGRNLIRWTERDHHNNNDAASPVRRPLQTLIRSSIPSPKKKKICSSSSNPPGHRMIVLKSRLHGSDAGRHHDDGGTTSLSKDTDAAGASKRKFEPPRSMISMNIDMYERSMVHMARRLPVERATEGRYEVRVCGHREEGEFYGDDDSHLFLEDSHPVEERPRITVDLREALNRRTRAATDDVAAVGSRENRGFEDGDGARVDVKVRVRRVDFDLSFANGKSTLAAASEVRKKTATTLPPNNDEGKSLRIGASAAGFGNNNNNNYKSGDKRDTEAERRQEKRERWAEKERDLERDLQKELQKQELQKQQLQQTMAKAQQPKSVTVVDYSHKFTVAKAPLGVPVKPVESDPHRLCQRQKQIDYGKNTLGYERYTEMVPRYQRTKAHPRTPDIRQVCSKRSWDGQIRKWRRLLHEYDPPKEEDDEDPDQMFVPTSREHDGIRSSAADDSMMDMQSELVEDTNLKIYDGWSDEEC